LAADRTPACGVGPRARRCVLSAALGLRSIDFRFVLPGRPDAPFQRVVLLGGTEAQAELLRRTCLAARVDRELTVHGAADAVVALRGARVRTDQLADALAPGGTLYVEGDHRDRLGRTKRALVRSGLEIAAVYWVYPSFARRRMYVPIAAGEPLRWYLRSLAVADTFPGWLRLHSVALLASLGSRALEATAQSWAMTAQRPAPAASGTLAILQHPDLPPAFHRNDARTLVLTGADADDFNRVVLFPFAPGAPAPIGILKLTRVPERNSATENEQAAQHMLRGRLPDSLRPSVPEPLALIRWRGLAAGAETCAHGRLVAATSGGWASSRARKVADLRAVTDWITAFHRSAPAGPDSWDAATQAQWLEQPLMAFERRVGLRLAPDEVLLFATLRKRSAELHGARLPMVWVHWGLAGQNVYRTEDRTTVIDWEGAAPGPPLFDLLYFVANWYGVVQRRRGFHDLFLAERPADAVIAAGRTAIARYVTALDVDPRFVGLLLAVMCLARTIGRLERAGATAGPALGTAAGNRYIEWVQMLARHAACTGRLVAADLAAAGDAS